MGVPTDVMCADQAMVDGRASWTSQAAAAGYYGPSGQAVQTVPDGRHAGVDTARVAGSNVNLASWTPSVWAGVEPTKLYTDAGQPYWNSSIAGILPLAYLGQPNQLRLAAPMPYMSGYMYPPLVMNPGTGTVPVPILNHPVESWVQAPLGQLSGAPPNASAQAWEAGFMPESRGMRPSTGSLERFQIASRAYHRRVIREQH